jgi:spermidine/putrescine transport system ATP-binding protein
MSAMMRNEGVAVNESPDGYRVDSGSTVAPIEPQTRASIGSGVSIQHVTKRFGEVLAVNDVSMDIEQNEFFSILGPSGCGKTTLMRMIAGFEQASSGNIVLLGQPVERLPPSQRNLNMVFQNYALFPHLSVYQNVAFELKVRRIDRSTIDERVNNALALVQMSDFGKRKPSQLSGGQRQRVALARALVGHPAVLLLDEPLGALDQKLRKEMQIELKRLQREVGITFIYVTHDQEEALTMSDRIAVMQSGRVLQIDTPRSLYERPTSRYVASFIGQSNFLTGKVAESTSRFTVVDTGATGVVHTVPEPRAIVGDEVTVAIRPERLRLVARGQESADVNAASGTVREVIYVGNDTHYIVDLARGVEVTVREQNSSSLGSTVYRQGDAVSVQWSPEGALVLLA